MAVGVLRKSYPTMTPSAFGERFPCCIADGTPTKRKWERSGFLHKKKTHPRQIFSCGYQCDKTSHRLDYGISYVPETTSLWIQVNYTTPSKKMQLVK